MTDIIIILLILLIIGGAGLYVYRAKKAGKKCIGCPVSGCCSANTCSGSCASCSGCSKPE